MFPLFRLLLVFGLGLAVQAAVGARALFGQCEDLRQLLLNGGDAAGILAADDVGDALGQLELALFDALAVLDDVDGDAGVDIADDIPVKVEHLVDLDDVLAAEFAARNVLEQRDGAVELVKAEDVVKLHRLAGGDVVDNDTIGNSVDDHV